jgi:DNA-binding HxlR family transcriptional regulator
VTTYTTASSDGRFDIMTAACPTRQVINQIGSRWGLLIVTALDRENLRFNQLRTRVGGVSQKVLTQTLRLLERDGIVHREVLPGAPASVEYSLTPLGRSLITVVVQLREWAYGNMDAIEDARRRYDDTEGI